MFGKKMKELNIKKDFWTASPTVESEVNVNTEIHNPNIFLVIDENVIKELKGVVSGDMKDAKKKM